MATIPIFPTGGVPLAYGAPGTFYTAAFKPADDKSKSHIVVSHSGSGAATITLEGSIDSGTTWIELSAGLVATNVVVSELGVFTMPLMRFKLVITGLPAGDAATFRYHDYRS